MPVVACPKCKSKFKLSNDLLGKAIRCKSCKAAFRTAAPKDGATAKAGTAKPDAPETRKRTKTAAAAVKKPPKSLEDELFASPKLPPGAPDPLGNFVLEDPGFGALELPDPENDDDSEDLFADRQHLMENPALKGRNPYATPSMSGTNSGGSKKQARKLRQHLLKHEGEIKSLAWLSILGGVFGLFVGVILCIVPLIASADSAILPFEASALVLIAGVLLLLFNGLQIVFSWYLYKLKGWAKIATTIGLVIGLLGVPLGTAACGYFLWVLHGEKGKQVFSEEYRRAMEATPDMSPSYTTLYLIIGLSIVFTIGAIVFQLTMI